MPSPREPVVVGLVGRGPTTGLGPLRSEPALEVGRDRRRSPGAVVDGPLLESPVRSFRAGTGSASESFAPAPVDPAGRRERDRSARPRGARRGRLRRWSRSLEDLRFRGLVHQMTDPGARRPPRRRLGLTAYSGFDPTADSLHVGHLLQLCNLRRLQLAGHRPIALAGGATGLIGDPGGKSEERTLLSAEELRRPTWRASDAQLRALPRLRRATRRRRPRSCVDNADWLGSMSLLEFLRDVGKHFTVNQMVAKESVRSPAGTTRPGHLLHRVQLHAPPGLRLPPPLRRLRLPPPARRAATSGGTSPWASS